MARLRDPAARVSSHYVVEEDGAVFRLVPEERRAWHAGVSALARRRGAERPQHRHRDRQPGP
ncbi:N-acetylmuramoyl-L-alanine amidase [Dankookia sp. P2]|uniref:N-acetylmuramoyl-L-alanine amidase n=1 Tax=Dankookia sp. P2 TaxID=3423955 RepID=UPI003D678AC7